MREVVLTFRPKVPKINQFEVASELPCILAIGARCSHAREIFRKETMLRITWDTNGEVVFTVSGRLDAENVGDVQALFSSEADGRRIVLNLLELTLVDRDAVRFLEGCEADGIELRNCPTYIREWITAERQRG